MAAKKPAPKAGKAKKPAVAKSKPAARKSVPAKKIPLKTTVKTTVKASEPVKRVAAVKPAAIAKPAVVAKPAVPAEKADKKTVRSGAAPTVVPRVVPSPGDGADDTESNESLLAGPRNVQPYVAKRGEQYMNKEQLEHFRKILQSWKQDLMMEVDRTVSHMKEEAANFPDPNDRATQEEEFSLELRTRDRERKLIRKIDEALGRIEDSSYGYCLETGEQIGVKRLEARPVATLSIEAQERRERREKQFGDRDDRYR
jgi:DnaK suppressor protein